MSFVLDSSVVAKLFFKEAGSDEAQEFMELCAGEEIRLIASRLLLYELGNVIWKNTRKKEVDGRMYLRQLQLLNIEYQPLGEELMLKAMKTARDQDISYYDAVHVTLAQMNELAFVTEDRKLLERFGRAMTIEQALEVSKKGVSG